jgi:signal transduction histidine kinase
VQTVPDPSSTAPSAPYPEPVGATTPRLSATLAGVTALGAGLVAAGAAAGDTLTGLALVALAAGVVVDRRPVRVAVAAVVVVLVALTLTHTVVDIALLALAAAQLLLDVRRWRAAQVAAFLALVVGGVTTLGHLLAAGQAYEVPDWAQTSGATSLLITVLALAHLGLVAGGVVPWTVADPGPGAQLMRRFAVFALLVLPALGWLRISLVEADVVGERSGIALVLSGVAALVLLSTYRFGKRLDEESRATTAAREDLQRLNDSLVEGRDEAWARAEALSRSLEEEQARFARAIGRVHDLFWTLEVLPEGRVEVQYATANARLLLGGELPAGADPITAMASYVHPDDHAARDRFEASVLRGEAAEVELRLVGMDGVTRWVWARGVPRREGERLFYDGMTTDVSERRALADQREALLLLEREKVEELRDVARMRDEFISVAGHELRTPLTSVLGYARRLLGSPGLTPDQERALRVIVARSTQVTDLIEELFEAAELNAGMTRTVLRPLDLGGLALEAARHHQEVADAAGVRLVVEALPCPVLADAGALGRALDKLVSAALTWTPAGGEVHVLTRHDGRRATASVVALGLALSPEQTALAFEHFFSGAGPLERGADGSRLGLGIVKAVVEAHGGAVDVVAAGDDTTELRMDLPLQVPDEAVTDPPGVTAPAAGTSPA